MIFKIQPLRNPSIFNNIICVLISKVLLMGMSNHPDFEIFWTLSKIWRIKIFFQNSKFHVRKNCCWCHQWAIYQKKILTKFFFSKFQNFHVKNRSSVKWKKKIKTLSAHFFLKVELVPQFRKLLNVWHIQNLEQPFLIWACNCLVKFWRGNCRRKSKKVAPNFRYVIHLRIF